VILLMQMALGHDEQGLQYVAGLIAATVTSVAVGLRLRPTS